jgi:DNA-binding PadR family transcriptional regulator
MTDSGECACSGRTLGKHVRPAALAVLAAGPTHGYDIAQKLSQLAMFQGGSESDASVIYRILKLMEVEGLVHGDWQLGDSGPARRRVAITEDGRDCLRRWIESLTRYRDGIDELLVLMRANAGEHSH